MIFQEMAVVAIKISNHWRTVTIDTHFLKRFDVRDQGNSCLAGIVERNESAIEKMIDGRNQEETVDGSQSLLVVRFPPWLDVAGNQMDGIANMGS